MPEEGTLWPIEEHTRAKHHILRRYLEAWAPILLQPGYQKGVLYIDGFAGPGEYTGGEHGSPVIALECLANHKLLKNFKGKISFSFVEKRKDRAEHLASLLKDRKAGFPPSFNVHDPRNGEFNDVMKGILKYGKEHNLKLNPVFCFVDPFGWEDLDYEVLGGIMEHPKAELFITFMSGFLNRFMTSGSHQESIERLFTPDQIRSVVIQNDSAEKRNLILKSFLTNLKQYTSKYTNEDIYDFSFTVYGTSNTLLYHLIYFTKSCAGLNAMKEAMYSVKKDGEYSFSDFHFDPGQSTLISYLSEPVWVGKAAQEIFDYFREILGYQNKSGSFKMPVEVVKNTIKCHTNWIYRAPILCKLQDERKIEFFNPTGKRRKEDEFPDWGAIIFNF